LNKTTKIAFSALSIAVIVVALGVSIYYLTDNISQTNSSAIPSGTPPLVDMKITGDIAEVKTLTISELTHMPITSVTTTIKDETANYVGITVTQLLNSTGASWDVGFINVIAGDGFKRTINTYQAYNSTQYSGNEFILAFAKDGQWITDSTDGPLKLITPGLATNYNVKSVAEINLQPWTVTVNGSVSHPLVLTGSNITDYEVKTVTAPFAPGGEPQRTSDWTGVTLESVLQASGASSKATKITVFAIDGYSRE